MKFFLIFLIINLSINGNFSGKSLNDYEISQAGQSETAAWIGVSNPAYPR